MSVSRTRFALAALVLAAAASSCSSGGPSAAPSPAATDPATAPTGPATAETGASAGAADWPTYHRANSRTGFIADFGRPSGLSEGWTQKLDGPVYAQPLVVGSTVVAATQNDTVYGLDLATGRTLWSRHVGTPVPLSSLPCGNIDPLGITGTPAYDSATGLVFVVAETTNARHNLVALDLRHGGAVRFTRNLDVTNRNPKAEQQRAALAVANGRVYVAFGGLFGDCGNYVGYVAAVATDGAGPIAHYEVPTAREAGIWAPSGPAVAANGDVYVAVGNGASFGGTYDGSDSVLRLSGDLSRRLSYFAPTTWGSENAEDADLGSTGPVLLPGGLVAVSGKNGKIYLLDATNLGGIGGEVASVDGCSGFGGLAYADGAAYVPCTSGVTRVDVAGRTIRKRWQAASVPGTPVIGGNTVWALNPSGGTLYALDTASGKVVAQHQVGTASRFSTPVLSGGRVLVGTDAGITAVTVTVR
jgi:outer membrane protein assembly factor BamB